MGAIIGYSTNWLAIKTLFRPHNEKRLFGIRVPFTPGLLPKGRFLFSTKIGEVTKKRVLTDDALCQMLSTDGIRTQINTTVNDFLARLADSEKPIRDLLIEYNIAVDADKLTDSVFCDEVLALATDKLYEKLVSLRDNDEWILQKISKIDEAYLSNAEFRSEIINKIRNIYDDNKEKSPAELLPLKSAEIVSEFINVNIPRLIDFLLNGDFDRTQIDDALKSLVIKIADENFGKLIGIFVNYEKIYENIKSSAVQYLQDEKNTAVICGRVLEFAEKVYNTEVGSLVDKVPIEIKDGAWSAISGLADKTTDIKFVLHIYEFLKEKYANDTELMHLAKWIVTATVPDLRQIVSENINKLFDIKVSQAYRFIIRENDEIFADKINQTVSELIQSGSKLIVGSIDIGKVVEQKINDFEVQEVEEIILSVVKKELSAITLLGGILGFIIGFFPVIMNMQ